MQRVRNQRAAEAIGRAYSYLPGRLAERLGGVGFVTGVDPIFSGLHGAAPAVTHDGRDYRRTGHCTYVHNQLHLSAARRQTTVVLPEPDGWHPFVVVHELGHALHEIVGFGHRAAPTTAYSRTTPWEAFAEAFTLWVWRRPHLDGYDAMWRDLRTRALFRELAA